MRIEIRWSVLACVLIASCLRAAEVQPSGATASLEEFTRHDEFGELKLSPDGQVVAAMAGKYGRGGLVFLGVKDRKLISGIQAPKGFEIFDFEWVSDTRVIYFVAKRQVGEVYPTRFTDIFAVDRDGRNWGRIYTSGASEAAFDTGLRQRRLSYARAKLISTLENDDRHILIAEYAWIERSGGYYFDPKAMPLITQLNVYNGKTQHVDMAPLRAAQVIVDVQNQVRFAVGYDENSKLTALWKARPDAPWESFGLPGFREDTVFPLSMTAGNAAALVSGVREGESLQALFRIDLQSRAVEKLYQHTEVDLSYLLPSLSDDAAVGVQVDAGKPQNHWFNDEAPTALVYKRLERAFPGQSILISSTTRDGKLALVFVSSDVNPGEYYLFDVQQEKADFLLAVKSWIDPRLMRPKEVVNITARDGLILHGYLTRPAASGPQPLVILPHGGPHGVRDYWSFDWEAQLLASRGYAVLQVNFRGSPGYGEDFQSAGHRQWGAKMQDDLTDATRWAIEIGAAQSDRICIYGAGYGGYAALMGAVREPKLYRCVAGYMGVYDLELMVTARDVSNPESGRKHSNRVRENEAELRNRSPFHNASRIEIPVLLMIHRKVGVLDDYLRAKRMKAALEANQKPLEWMALSGEGHGIYDEDTRRQIYEKLLAFLDRNLAPAATAAQSERP